MTLAELVARYLQHCDQNHVHTAQARAERLGTLNRLCTWVHNSDPRPLGDYQVSELLPYHLEDWIAANKGWRSSSTRKAKVNQVNALLNWAKKGRRIAENPFAHITFPEAPPRPCLPDQVLETVCAASNKRYERLLRFLRFTGRRLSEAAVLRWDHIDWDNAVAVLPPDLHKAGKRTGRSLTIPLVPDAVELLRRIEASDKQPELVFVNNRGKAWTRGTLGQQLRRLKVRKQITTPASLHGIRHQVGTEAVRGGVHLKMVSQALGHSNTAITERFYVHTANDVAAMRDALQASLRKMKM